MVRAVRGNPTGAWTLAGASSGRFIEAFSYKIGIVTRVFALQFSK
jgi:hypothetical protein